MMADTVPARVPLQIPNLQTLRVRIIVESNFDALQRHIPAWESLACSAIAPNPFYEPWMLIPALREMADDAVRVVFVYDEAGTALYGVVPVERRRSYRGLPIPNLRFWKHKYCFLCTPLLRAGFAETALAAYFDWAETDLAPWSLLHFNHTAGDGPFPTLLNAELERRDYARYHIESFERAMIRPGANGSSYLEANVSNGRRKEWRRQLKRLREQRSVDFVELESEADMDTWIRHFMDLEASGWKGRAGSAILLDANSRRFFSQAMHGAFQRGKLMMLGLRVNGIPIALKCNIRSGSGAFAFKIAYSEEFRSFSPGLQLELENIHRLHQNRGIQWMDSCAEPNHAMIDHLWAERRTIQTVAVSAPGRFTGSIRLLMNLRNRYASAFGKLRSKVSDAS